MVKAGGQSLSTLNRGCTTPENSIQVFEIIILQLLEWLGVEWSEMQIRETAELMSAEYYWMTLPEIKAFTSKVKTGAYGKEWGKLRPMTLMGWMMEWAAELKEARASLIGMAKPEPAEDPNAEYVDVSRITSAIREAFNLEEVERKMNRDYAEHDEIYRQEKIKQRQRDVMRNQEKPEP